MGLKVFDFREVEPKLFEVEGAKGKVYVRWLLTEKDGANKFWMRYFEMEPGSNTPRHRHPWEHEAFILEGEGVVIGEGGKEYPLKPGTVVFVPPNELHEFRNTGNTVMKILCIIPAVKEAPGR
ncbi:MAG TPA: cupin domain-containing protein [Candidatus Bathyarchaeota archaeon]|nr:cupin domain-containing protein [Candidatus Bathyarchaeota archaeon]